jgi:hypothetical protein
MPTKHPAPSDEHALVDRAHELHRAAGHVQKRAAASDALQALCFHLRSVADALSAPQELEMRLDAQTPLARS